MALQQELDEAFENYFALSNVLTADLEELLSTENESLSWKRNYIRTITSLLEGYSHCFREMASIGLKCQSPTLSEKECKTLLVDRGISTIERIKLTLKATYKMFGLSQQPDFSGEKWKKAMLVFKKRDELMHPKTPHNLDISKQLWSDIEEGASWIVEQHFNVIKILQDKHLNRNQ